MRQQKTMCDLHQMEQKKDKIAPKFLNRVLDVMIEIHDLNSEKVIVPFVKGLTLGSMLSDKPLKV